MTRLHVAAMPFPSVQGTQAAVRMMMDAEHAAGIEPELLTYAHGGFELAVPWTHHRMRDLVRDRSLRSGPSWRKIAQDAQLVVELRRVHARTRPRAVIAHHVEAAAAAQLARCADRVFFAHTALKAELPTYLEGLVAKVGGRAGEALDIALARGASSVAAISPWLADHLQRASGREVRWVPVPWPVPAPIDTDERVKARARFGLGAVEPVVLYAGNLDAYQGVDVMAEAYLSVRERRPDARLLVATESDREPVERRLWPSGAASEVVFASLVDEPDRRAVHAACDVAWVPRRAPGGLPMKLLDALSRGVPTVVVRRATAGLDLGDVATVVADDDPQAFAAGALLAFEGRGAARARGARARAWMNDVFSPDAYLRAMSALV